MDIKDFFSGMFSNKPKNVLQTPYGNFNLAKGKDIKRVQKMVIDLQRTTDALTRKDSPYLFFHESLHREGV